MIEENQQQLPMNSWSLRNNQLKLLEIVESNVVWDFEKFFEKFFEKVAQPSITPGLISHLKKSL